ncbi:MAG TPA: hypothetical protein VIN72_08085 [Lutibacter sp.]
MVATHNFNISYHINLNYFSKKSRLILIIGALLLIGCNEAITTNPEYVSDGSDFPVGKPNAKGYYDAQPFGKNRHLGSDWNGKG